MTDVPLKHLCVAPPEYGLNIPPDRYKDDGIRLLRTSDIGSDGSVSGGDGVYLVPADVPVDLRLDDGDILFSRSGTLGRALLYDRSGHGDATFAGFLVRFRLRDNIDPRAVRYWSESAPFAGTVASEAIQSTISNFNAEKYSNLRLPAYLVANSEAIADYLDAETAHIDEVALARRKQATLLDSKIETAMWSSVTKGIRQAEHASSRLEWAGEMPSHWTLPTVGANFEVQLGKMLSPDATQADEKLPYLRNVNVQWDRIDTDDLNEMHFDGQDRLRYALAPGDLMVCEGGEVGRSAVWDGRLAECYYQKALHRVRPWRDASVRYLMYALWAAASRGVFENEGNTSTIVHLTAEKLRAHRFPWPPRAEQDDIVDELDGLRHDLDRTRRALDAQIELLLERRQALVTAAVTGQLEIPSVAV